MPTPLPFFDDRTARPGAGNVQPQVTGLTGETSRGGEIAASQSMRRPTAGLGEISAANACLLAGCIGFVYALLLFGPGFAGGSSVYWQRPVGLVGGPIDMKINLSGYYWIVHSGWHWPLLWLPHLDAPYGLNAYQFDSVPGLALIGKLLDSLFSTTINLYPAWFVGVITANSIALTMLVRALGQRSLLAAVVSAGFGALVPIVHFRFGHPSLMAQFLPVLALAFCLELKNSPASRLRCIGALLALCLVAATVNLYIYVMTAAIAASGLIQLSFDRHLHILSCLANLVGCLFAGFVPVWAFGALGDPNLRGVTVPFGYNSMNLLSPFWPQSSGLFHWTGWYFLTRGLIGATPGQWEGYAYLGSGALLLLLIALILCRRSLPGQIRKNWVLACSLLLLTVWALSSKIYLGPILVASYPVPDLLAHTLLAWFRASGRFFWPVAWLATALGIAGTIGALRPRVALVVAMLALLLQWTDVSLLRNRISEVTRTPAPSAFGSQTVADRVFNEIAARRRVAVIPSFACRAGAWDHANGEVDVADAEAQLMAARANADMRRPTGARSDYDCARETEQDVTSLAGDGVLIALTLPTTQDRTEEARRELACWQMAVGWVCTSKSASNR